MLMNKTTIEWWNILKYEIESIIDTFFPLKNKENGLERNSYQKKLLEKIVFKQTMWMVYRCTRKDENYANYKEVLNLATTKLSTDCVTASSVNMFKNKVDTYLMRAGYK